MNVSDGDSTADPIVIKKRKRKEILGNKKLNIWQKKFMLEELDEQKDFVPPVPPKPYTAPKIAPVKNSFTYLNKPAEVSKPGSMEWLRNFSLPSKAADTMSKPYVQQPKTTSVLEASSLIKPGFIPTGAKTDTVKPPFGPVVKPMPKKAEGVKTITDPIVRDPFTGGMLLTKEQNDAMWAEYLRRHPENTIKPVSLYSPELPSKEEWNSIAKDIFTKPYTPPSDVTKMTYDDYIEAWENKDWKTTEKYVDAARKGATEPRTITQAQSMRMLNNNIDEMPQWTKELSAGVLGATNGLTMNAMEGTFKRNADQGNFIGSLLLHSLNRLKNEAPISYGVGEFAGQMVPMIATGNVVSGPLKVISNPLVRNGLTGALSTGVPIYFSNISKGVPAGQAALNALPNTALGAFGGVGVTILGEVLPQAGTIAYQQLLERGGLSKMLGPAISNIGRGLSPEAAAANDSFRLGNGWDRGYNSLKALGDNHSNGGVLDNAKYAQKTFNPYEFSKTGQKIYTDKVGRPITGVNDLVDAIVKGEIDTSSIPIDYYVKDGNTIILDTRSSQALTLAGIPRDKWYVVNRTGQLDYEGRLLQQLGNNKLTSAGTIYVLPKKGE